ncbi:hypothetical protein MMC11_005393 [Xylographa trunciseda]|nr:hypothetical protein [Xylographa trunciseda]
MSVFSDDFDAMTGEELLEAEREWKLKATSFALPYLPDEVLLMIFESLQKKYLKHVRLVCQRWSHLPIRLLFNRVFLSHYSKDLDVFSQITSRPEMSSSVTELVFGTSRFIEDLSFDSYVQQLLTHPCAVRAITDPEMVMSNEDRKMNDFIRRKQQYCSFSVPNNAKSLAAVQRGYEAYKKASEEQSNNRKNGEAMIRFGLSLKSLHRLRSVHFNHEWLAYSTLKSWRLGASDTLVRYESPFLRSWHSFYLPPSQHLTDLGSELSAMMTALALSSDCPTRLHTIKVPDMFLEGIATHPAAYQHMSDVVRDVEVFEIGTRDVRREITALQHRQTGLPSMFRSMPKLKILDLGLDKVVQESRTLKPVTYLRDLLGAPAPYFQQLSSLTLACVACAQVELINFVSSHPSLRILYLKAIELTQGDWASTIGGLRQHLRLKAFDLVWPILQKGGVTLWTRGDLNGEHVRQQLVTFVLHGGDNPLIDDSGKPIFFVEERVEVLDDDESTLDLLELFEAEDEMERFFQEADLSADQFEEYTDTFVEYYSL